MRAFSRPVANRRTFLRPALAALTVALASTAASAASSPPAVARAADPASPADVTRPLVLRALAAGEGAEAAIAELRLGGPSAVDALLAVAPPEHDPSRTTWARTLDAVCAQRDCAASGLYWYTDLDQAIAAAEASGRPILSLRLLGRLDEELSCANSRFFRTVLYPDPEVSERLRDGFVLHWRSVRPAPRLSIDFGGGRRLEGTITGNSAHLVLDSRGRLIDVLPGLYGPGLFLDRLERAGEVASSLAAADGGDYLVALSAFHRQRLAELDLDLAGMGGLDAVAPRLALGSGRDELSDVREAEALAMTKSFIEVPVVEAVWRASWRPVLAGGAPDGFEPFDWQGLAAARRSDWRLSEASLRLLAAKHRPVDREAGERVIAGFERLVGLDTVRNEYLLHSVVHRWLADEPGVDPRSFVRRLYAQLFLTPDDDPWLGLVSADTYLALERPLEEPSESPAPVAEEAIRSSADTIRRADGVLR